MTQLTELAGQSVQIWLVGASHSCLVAQIAYTDAPIINANGVIESPENSDKLAQRNLQVTHIRKSRIPRHSQGSANDRCPSQPARPVLRPDQHSELSR